MPKDHIARLLAAVALLFVSLTASAQLSPSQVQALKTACVADVAICKPLHDAADDAGLAAYFNASSVTHIVWRTDVTRAQIYHTTSGEGTTWNWTTYKNQSIAEQNAWVQMFMGDQADFSLPNLRAGVDAIFSGAGGPATQRAHVAAIAKRVATRAEKALATGTGTLAVPATMTFQGQVTTAEASLIRS